MRHSVIIAVALLHLPCLSTASGWGAERTARSAPGPTFETAPAPAAMVVEGDSFPLDVLATVEFSYWPFMAFGDTDHDDANELVFTGESNAYRIWEHKGNDVYSLEALGTSTLHVFAVGDLDRDGRSEVIGQSSGYVQIFESLDSSTHPFQLVWSSPYLSNTHGYTTSADTDRDGRMEIIHSINGIGSMSGLVVFEIIGDNDLGLVFETTLFGPSSTGLKVIADLDGDGLVEIALCGSPGWLHVFESPCDDTWVLTFREWTGLWNAYTVVGGRDTDGNGRPEVFVVGDSMSILTTRVYESSGNDDFVRAATLVTDEGLGPSGAVVCDVDGAGFDEFLLVSGPGIRVFRASTPGQWRLIGSTYDYGGGIYAFDLNRNGRPEIVQHWYTGTRILEYRDTPTSTNAGSKPFSLHVTPNPCRLRAWLDLPGGTPAATTLSVLDVRGRVVERLRVDPAVRSIPWAPPGDLPAGVYFLQLEDRRGGVVARGKGTIVR